MTRIRRRSGPRYPSLRRILIYVAFGSAFLPGVLVSAIFTLTHGHIAEGPIMRMVVATEEVSRAAALDSAGRLVVRRGYASPAWLDLVLEDTSGEVVFSTIPSIAQGSRPSLLDIASFANSLVPKTTFIVDRVEIGRVDAGTWFAIVPSDAARSLAGQSAPLLRLTGLSVFALIALVFGLTVAAALASEVGRLEKAAIAIASGDLESPVRAKGAREIVALAAAMEKMRASIRENNAGRARFLASVSHDLRTPLTSIGGFLEAVEDGLADDPETLKRYVGIMKEKTGLLEERIEGLIDIARMESGEWRLRFESQDLGQLFGEFAAMAREESALSGATLHVDLAAIADVIAPVDRSLLARAFENLVVNALAHGRPGGEIMVSSRRLEDGEGRAFFAIDVDDDGPGIPEAEREKAFDAFWRGAAAKEGKGLGLGLFIARTIVEGHGWRLGLSASPAGGARFSVLVPAEMTEKREGRS
ncbi:MAG TPA: HAMP domain-containing sensor histidine kinase [Rectinemataceae bacterium]|nr:HAMP domain-containing sensor histidine kinase [Rectinemataceae bacterium]